MLKVLLFLYWLTQFGAWSSVLEISLKLLCQEVTEALGDRVLATTECQPIHLRKGEEEHKEINIRTLH